MREAFYQAIVSEAATGRLPSRAVDELEALSQDAEEGVRLHGLQAYKDFRPGTKDREDYAEVAKIYRLISG